MLGYPTGSACLLGRMHAVTTEVGVRKKVPENQAVMNMTSCCTMILVTTLHTWSQTVINVTWEHDVVIDA